MGWMLYFGRRETEAFLDVRISSEAEIWSGSGGEGPGRRRKNGTVESSSRAREKVEKSESHPAVLSDAAAKERRILRYRAGSSIRKVWISFFSVSPSIVASTST
jgi:hypothetical protein